jgi:hypothetical protein
MARLTSVLLIAALALAIVHLRQPTFVPPALRRAAPAAIPAVAMMGAAPAFADEIGDAAKKLSSAAYPFLKEVDWNSGLALMKPGSASAAEVTKAIAKAIDMGAAMDSNLVKAGVQAHHKAIGSAKAGVTSQADFEAVNAAIGRMIASVPESKTMDVYNAFSAVVSPDVPNYLMSTVKEADAKAAYAALMDFKDVVKAHPITPASVSSKVSGAGIDEAARKLSAAAYPFLKDIDWSSDLALKNPGSEDPQKVLKAVDKALVMGAAMDGAALKEAALAHVAAIGSMDAKGVTTQADFQAINAGLGKAIASVPTSTVMDVYNAFKGIVSPSVPNYLMSSVNANDAFAAYKALLEFKDVVKAAR